MRRVDREPLKEDKKSANRMNVQIELNSEETQRTTPDSRSFALTENQRLIIQHKLPKGYALLLVPKSTSNIKKNSNRLRNYSPTSTKNYEKQQNTP
jgi:hypothetical protein